jgi:AcrR family transcriptional regulator
MASSLGEPRSDSRRNREAVLDAAERLLGEHPDASMGQIADASGVGRTTVYRHFPTREDLLEVLVERVMTESRATVAEVLEQDIPTDEALRELGEAIAALGERFTFLAAYRPLVEEARKKLRQTEPLERFIDAARRRGSVRTDLPRDWLVAMLRGMSSAAVEEVREGRINRRAAGRMLGESFVALFSPARSALDQRVET